MAGAHSRELLFNDIVDECGMSMQLCWNDNERGKPIVVGERKMVINIVLSTSLIWTGLGLKPVLCDYSPATNRLKKWHGRNLETV